MISIRWTCPIFEHNDWKKSNSWTLENSDPDLLIIEIDEHYTDHHPGHGRGPFTPVCKLIRDTNA